MNAPIPHCGQDTTNSLTTSARTVCPRCQGSVYRIPRRFIDLLITLLIPVRRYRCREMGCSWEGNVRIPTQPARGAEEH